jgi:hypothetical protein
MDWQDQDRMQVEKHMCVCLVMNPGFETAVTIAPSEPLLAEAAYLLMQDHKSFDLPRVVLLLISRNVAVQEKYSPAIEVLLFIQKLLASKWYLIVLNSRPAQCCTGAEGHCFSDVFTKSKMYFNHLIKVHGFKVIN